MNVPCTAGSRGRETGVGSQAGCGPPSPGVILMLCLGQDSASVVTPACHLDSRQSSLCNTSDYSTFEEEVRKPVAEMPIPRFALLMEMIILYSIGRERLGRPPSFTGSFHKSLPCFPARYSRIASPSSEPHSLLVLRDSTLAGNSSQLSDRCLQLAPAWPWVRCTHPSAGGQGHLEMS